MAIFDEEWLTNETIGDLTDLLNAQPVWAEVSLLVLADGGSNAAENGIATLADHGNVVPLFRPLQPQALRFAVRNALRGSRRLVQVRDRLKQHVQVLASIQDAFATLDFSWRYTYVNDHTCRLCKMRPEQMLGHTIWELFPHLCGTALEEYLRRVMNERVSIHFEWHNERWDRWFAIRLYPSEDGLAMFTVEITGQKRIEAVLEESERRLHLALDTSYLGTWYCDLPLAGMTWDANCKRHFGLPLDADVDIDRFYSLLHAEDRERTREAIERSIAERAQYDVVYRAVHPDGTERWIHAVGRPFYRNGVPFRFDGITIDITDRKQSEIELLRARQEAVQASQAKDHFLAAVSHELRTPLTPVLMTIAAMRQDEEFPRQFQADLGLIYRNVELEARLIDDLLDLTRVTQGKLVLHSEVTDLHELLDHTIHMCCGPEVIPKPLAVVCNSQAGIHHAYCDPARIQQVLWNLINNAIKFTPEHGRITIETRNSAEDRIEVTVTDTGIGIEPDVLPRIFSAFEQGDTTITRRFGGLGLGLAISKTIAELHGGKLMVASEGRGKGATFTFEMVTCAKKPTADFVALPNVPTRIQSLRILLAEDHEPTRKVLSRLLTRGGHQVESAGTVAEAVELAGRGSFDLLVSDLGLPDATGRELMQQLRSLYGMRGIALSGYGMEEDIKASVDAGFAIHLTKPVDWHRLQAAVNTLAGGIVDSPRS